LREELDASPDLVILFATSHLDPEEVLAGVRSGLDPKTKVIGCSSNAEINSEEALTHSVTAMGCVLDRVTCDLFKLDSVGASSLAAGEQLGRQIAPHEPKIVIIFPDGMTTNTSELIVGLQSVLGADVPIVGGVAAEHLVFERTHEFFGDEVLCGGVVALALSGPLTVATAAMAGFQPVSGPRTCTRVEDNKLILELDGSPALEIYKSFLGDDVNYATAGIEFPLALITKETDDYMTSDESEHVIRVVRMLVEERGGLLCGGDVPQGSIVRMTRAVRGDLLRAAVLAVEKAKEQVPDPRIALVFDCAGRKMILGARYNEEIKAVFAALEPRPATIGFYTYGEISPSSDSNMYHDETFTVVLLGVE